jgi:hypothetical protein
MFKKTLLALAIATASTGAMAATNGTAATGSNLILGAVGLNAAGTQVSLAYNTGFLFNDFLPGTQAAGTSFTQNLGAAWTTFSGAVADLNTVEWVVFANDQTGAIGTPGDFRFMGTSNRPGNTNGTIVGIQQDPTIADRLNNADFQTWPTGQGNFVAFNNTLPTSDPNVLANTFGASSAQGGYAVSVRGPAGSDTNFASFVGNNIGRLGLPSAQVVDFDPSGALNEQRQFILWTRGTGGNTALAVANDYIGPLGGNSFNTFSLSSTGVLTYTVTPIPEPAETAMILAGLTIVGAIARRRKQAA